MTYQEMMSHIYDLGRFGMKPGLQRIRATLRALSDPQDAVQTVHVAGTNGKGSTATFLASILMSGGHKTGLFTSPHLVAFTERIRINGTEISETEVVSLADRVLTVAPEGTTFFEIVTAMAYLFFAEQGVRAAVMEVGMGGRFDATNVASGILSIITPIALDHSQYLGDTISLIAREKAGVIKEGRPVVSSSQSPEAQEVIRMHCMGMKSPLYLQGSDFSATWESDGLAYSGIQWELHALQPGIPGRYQAMNLATAICAAEVAGQAGNVFNPGLRANGRGTSILAGENGIIRRTASHTSRRCTQPGRSTGTGRGFGRHPPESAHPCGRLCRRQGRKRNPRAAPSLCRLCHCGMSFGPPRPCLA